MTDMSLDIEGTLAAHDGYHFTEGGTRWVWRCECGHEWDGGDVSALDISGLHRTVQEAARAILAELAAHLSDTERVALSKGHSDTERVES